MATGKRLVTFLGIDPVIQYSPSLDDTASTGGWQTTYTSNQTPPLGPSDFAYGVGDSRRLTESAGASLEFQFYGSSVSLYGSAPQIRYNVQVDNQPAQELTENGGVLAAITGLKPALHTIKLIVIDTSGLTFSFQRAEFDIGMRGDWKNSTYPARLGSPEWTLAPDSKLPWYNLANKWSDGSGRVQESVYTHDQGAKASLQFTGSAVYIVGNTRADHGRFKITLASPDKPETTAIYQGRTKYTTIETLMYFQGGLDPTKTHTVIIENFENAVLDVVRAVVATGEERHASSGSKSNIGAIVGGVVGSVGLLLMLAAFTIFILHRRGYRPWTLRRTDWQPLADTSTISPFPPFISNPVPGSQGHNSSQTALPELQQHGLYMQPAPLSISRTHSAGAVSGALDLEQRTELTQSLHGSTRSAPPAYSVRSS